MPSNRTLRDPEHSRVTLLDLVAAVGEVARNESETVATVAHMLSERGAGEAERDREYPSLVREA